MFLYIWMLYIAAFFGHRKARALVKGQRDTQAQLKAGELDELKGCIWFHAASVGEFEQARPVIERLRAQYPKRKILLTFFSPSGYELRKDYGQVSAVRYLPLASRRNARLFLEHVEPQMAIFIKYEFWPAYLRELHRRSIPTYIISAIFRPHQLFFRPWGKAYRRLLTYFTQLYVQDNDSKELLGKHGINNVVIAGDTRFDRVEEIAARAKQLPSVAAFAAQAAIHDRKIIVAGSTWPEDEELLIRYLSEHPDVQLVLVPHEIHESHLHQIFIRLSGQVVRYTEATPMNIRHVRVLLVDTIGVLSSIYQYGQVAYIGGGFGAGIHNTLEAAVYGIPVIFGPRYQHFREARGLIAAQAATSVSDYDQLRDALDNALADYTAIGAKARQYVDSERGATNNIYNEIFQQQTRTQQI